MSLAVYLGNPVHRDYKLNILWVFTKYFNHCKSNKNNFKIF